jgi:hypothetical protein
LKVQKYEDCMERTSGNIHGNGSRNISEIFRVSNYKDSIKEKTMSLP